MILIYRGLGVLVPIIIFLTGLVVSIWIKDTRIGNPVFIGWTSFYSAILCLLLGLVTFKPDEETDANGNRRPGKRAHFFYIPIVFWGPILGALSAYLLLWQGKKASADHYAPEKVATAPVIHFYNPTGDTLDYLIYTKNGLSEQRSLEPFSSAKVEAPDKSYVLGALDQTGEATMTLPYYEKYNAKLYETVNEDGRKVEQRLIRPLTADPSDYEDNWLLLDGGYDLLLVDVTSLYSGTVQKEKVASTDWTKKVKSRHEGTELIELSLKPSSPDGSVYLSPPYTYLPVSNSPGRTIYMVIVLGHEEEASNELLAELVERVIM